MILALVQTAALLAFGTAGVVVARRSPRTATFLCAAMLALILIKVVAGYLPAAEARLFPFDVYPHFEPWWYAMPAMALLGAGLVSVRRSVVKRDAILVVIGLLLLRTAATGWVTGRPHRLGGTVDALGACRQTSGYSCAAAASAAFLHRHGVAVTQAEMARLCVTRDGGWGMAGTSDSGILRGLRRKLPPGRTARIRRSTYDDVPQPSMMSVELGRNLGHSLLLVRAGAEEVEVMDSLVGYRSIPRATFERMWQRSAIWIE